MIEGLYETHINVTDLERSMAFYGDTLGLKRTRLDEQRRVAFYWVGEDRAYMLGLWERPDAIIRQHFAFRVSLGFMKTARQFLLDRGLTPRNFLDDGTQDPMVFGWMPAVALYFPDPDGHSLEFISLLDDPPRDEVGVVAWDEWNALNG